MDAPLRRAQKMADNCLCCHIGYISNSSKGIFETIVDKIQGREEIFLTPYPTQCGQNFSNLELVSTSNLAIRPNSIL